MQALDAGPIQIDDAGVRVEQENANKPSDQLFKSWVKTTFPQDPIFSFVLLFQVCVWFLEACIYENKLVKALRIWLVSSLITGYLTKAMFTGYYGK